MKDKKKRLPKQSRHYVAFLDLLGYKNYFESQENDTEEFLETIISAIEFAKEGVQFYGDINKTDSEPYIPVIKIFSDNILIAIKSKRADRDNILPYLWLISIVGTIQLFFIIKYSLFLRGGISKGLFFVNDQLVFGEALIKAYEMEQKAIYPKIMLDTEDVEKILNFIKDNRFEDEHSATLIKKLAAENIVKDNDGTFFINYFKTKQHFLYNEDIWNLDNFFDINPATVESHTQRIFFSDLHTIDFHSHMYNHQKVLIHKIKLYGSFDDIFNQKSYDVKKVELRRKVQLKYMWSIDFHNKICELTGYAEYMINYIISMDPLTHLPKVELK